MSCHDGRWDGSATHVSRLQLMYHLLLSTPSQLLPFDTQGIFLRETLRMADIHGGVIAQPPISSGPSVQFVSEALVYEVVWAFHRCAHWLLRICRVRSALLGTVK